MDSPDFKNTICRVCLDENVVLDWNNKLVEYSDITYKELYYKYTQLKYLEIDPFSSMLCQNCLNGLENIHSLILKAIDSHNFLLDVNCIKSEDDMNIEYDINIEETVSVKEISIIEDNSNIDDSQIIVEEISIEDDINYSTDFETVLVEKTDTESVDYFELENSDEEFFKGSVKSNIEKSKTIPNYTETLEEEINASQSLKTNNSKENNSPPVNPSKRKSTKENNEGNDSKKLKMSPKNTRSRRKVKTEDNQRKDSGNKSKSKTKQKLNSQNTPSMCSICSKILHNKYALQKHEKTHIENRERKAACPVCGIWFYEKAHVTTHMHIHREDRVKKHKCEFCDKAFYEKGALNVHKRIHLGQMIPCTLCSKEFFRQVDLDIHMNSHSAAPMNTSGRKRSRFWVRCKHCDKCILSTSFRSHEAAHLNDPLMKCSICERGFYRRETVTQHLKTHHQKTAEECNDFIIACKKNRLSHLYLEQNAEIIPNVD